MKSKLLHTLSLAVVPWFLARLMRLWFATCRVEVHNEEYLRSSYGSEKAVVASFWHYTIIYLFYFVRKYPATAMVSASEDGDYIAGLAGQLGFNVVRGSSNNRGVGALKKLMRAVRNGENSAIVADGSQGPVRIAQPGAVLLASRTGVPMLPMAWSASRYMTIKSWDKTAVPMPFSRIDFYYGELIFVPRKANGAEIERYRLQLEQSLNELYTTAWGRYDKLEH